VTVVDSAAPDFGKISWLISTRKSKVAELSCSVSERVTHDPSCKRHQQRAEFSGCKNNAFFLLKMIQVAVFQKGKYKR
jgi:hypothetical protein